MATYATFAELVQRYGLIELGKMIPRDAPVSPDLESLATTALVEAAGEIDSALSSAGYTVPIDTAAIVDVDQKARTIALLRRLEIGIGVGALSRETHDRAQSVKDGQGSVTFKTKLIDDMRWAREFLDGLRSGSESLPGLESPGSSFLIVSEPAVPSKVDVDDRFAAAGAY